MSIEENYQLWLQNATQDQDVLTELQSMSEEAKEDAFYRNLSFGTGGLRGTIGAGTNKLNIHTIAKASQGLADYLNKNYTNPSVSIGYDSRIKSDTFAFTAASVFAANNIKVYIYDELMPVPMVSYATRYLKCSAGVMITASHNPSKYNGYKVYGDDGCQITTEAAKIILKEIEKLDIFNDIKSIDFQEALENQWIEYISKDVFNLYCKEVENQSLIEVSNKDVSIIYSPLNGTGLKPILKVLDDKGYTNITVVEEQRQPDGKFPTCPFPNPEVKEAMSLGIQYCKKYNADLLLATDPDCDRVGIAVKHDGDYVLLSGNETGLLMLDYILGRLKESNKLPKNGKVYKTIVTTNMAEAICKGYNVELVNTLTGFKFIGEQICFLEQLNKQDSFIFGLEESYGYLRGTYVRDKDGVVAAMLICEMFSYYQEKGISLYNRLVELYNTYGYYLDSQKSFTFEGPKGTMIMETIMNYFRSHNKSFAGMKVLKGYDYNLGLNGLPKSNVLNYKLENNCSIIVRPSGTEPKLKCYFTSFGTTKQQAQEVEQRFMQDVTNIINTIISDI